MRYSAAAKRASLDRQEAPDESDVIHRAKVTVDEKGTVAAAATGAVMRTTAAPARIERLVVNRPFLFFVRDIPTGTLLLAGQVTDPTPEGG